MVPLETVSCARNFAVMVRVRGPDPKGLKMRKHAFHQYRSGETTLSASGMLVPDTLYDAQVATRLYGGNCEDRVFVVTVASVVEPFLSPQHRENIPQGRPDLISGVRIDVMTENTNGHSNQGTPCWLIAQLLSLVDIPTSSDCLQSLIEASLGLPEFEWEVGWSLASYNNDSQRSRDVFQTQERLVTGGSGSASLVYKSLTRMAILSVSLSFRDLLDTKLSAMNKRGDFLLAVGSPFGVLSPMHFFNSISVGCIANSYPSHSSDGSLLMADIRCLPGMEGGPVFSKHACLTGILLRPLRQKTYGAEIQLVVPWEAIVSASSGLLRNRPENTEKALCNQGGDLYAAGTGSFSDTDKLDVCSRIKREHLYFGSSSPLPIEKAMPSVCLVTIGDGVWASGVLLNSQGLILTNAHLLEPWRFGKEHVSGRGYGTNSEKSSSTSEGTAYLGNRVESNQVSQTSQLKMPIIYPFTANEQGGYKLLNPTYDNRRNIRVRLDHIKPWIWCDAKVVYVCKGPWDVALLQLESVLDDLLPITMEFSRPSTGSKAFVIGHGLFGPKRGMTLLTQSICFFLGFFPSVCSGVVAKVVEAKTPQSYLPIQPEHLHNREYFPAMLETTAAIHPGASGGAVINSDGHMIGLVTSNARHGGGTVIPHLNFSIPSAALAPISKFSKGMEDLSLLKILDESNEYLSSIWALMRPSYPNPHSVHDPPQSATDNKSKEKGSRFAKFIAERKDVFNVGKSGVLPKEVVPSKL
ncbi:glyoxysomal processing protease, glyoxysomal isoform X2 [Vigna umbellata]|uniref:glyoxysomal processing protease, glyoxysomal isoform X1 n=1 Tax=Vigna umbellata TaxID=87088 RepID=UPI001F5F0343|nr:glyoxysomal processing protease, glyoxysomal isoform X1 [Vigna umbellata]XP_047163561.1 glyoxysomal processing protease, glyoxysomal isoform X2 [Vigna umbellata]